jgi:hypothetical protein
MFKSCLSVCPFVCLWITATGDPGQSVANGKSVVMIFIARSVANGKSVVMLFSARSVVMMLSHWLFTTSNPLVARDFQISSSNLIRKEIHSETFLPSGKN